jgi:ribosomal protein S18 acetylase RimI-like enzyme
MRITGYKRKDFERVMEINDACYSGEYRPPRDTMADMISVCDVFLARHPYFGPPDYKADGIRIVGFAIVRNAIQPYLWNIAVDPEWQGKGIASKMLKEIIDRYTQEKSKQITLHVNAENPAQKLYFDHGFRVMAVEKDYFKPDDGLLLKRDL